MVRLRGGGAIGRAVEEDGWAMLCWGNDDDDVWRRQWEGQEVGRREWAMVPPKSVRSSDRTLACLRQGWRHEGGGR